MNKILKIEELAETYDLAGQVIGFAMKVHTTLGTGFLESVYENALASELRRDGMKIEAQNRSQFFTRENLLERSSRICWLTMS